jgi:hypothetical protein
MNIDFLLTGAALVDLLLLAFVLGQVIAILHHVLRIVAEIKNIGIRGEIVEPSVLWPGPSPRGPTI